MGPVAQTTELQGLLVRTPEAIERWFNRHCDPVYAYVFYRVGRDAGLASDVVQETFLQALQQIHRYDPDRGTMEAWLTTLSRNHITRALRAGRLRDLDRRQRMLDRALIRTLARMADEPLPEEILERQETRDLVRETLASMPGNYRTVLTLFYHLDLSLEQIASRIERSEGAVKVLLHRARAAFKEAFLRLGERGRA